VKRGRVRAAAVAAAATTVARVGMGRRGGKARGRTRMAASGLLYFTAVLAFLLSGNKVTDVR